MATKIVIIEDEPATARNLQYFLEKTEPGLQVLGLLSSIKEAVAWFSDNENTCDLIFMDIRLDDGLSFRIFEQVTITVPVVFVTAYDEYAIPAFKANGIDYILKPFVEKDLAQALTKFHSFGSRSGNDSVNTVLAGLAAKWQPTTPVFKQSFLVHFREKLIPVVTNEIAWFYTREEIVYLHTLDDRKFTVDFTMEILQQSLDPALFFRANRQFLISRKAIREIDFYFNNRLVIQPFVEPEEKIIVSKARVAVFKEWMNA